MAKKKNRNILLILMVIVLSIYLANYFGLFEGIKIFPLSIVPSCPSGDLCHESLSPFTCPTNVSGCEASGWVNCNVPTSIDKVIARVDDADYSSGWIALLNEEYGTLESWYNPTSVTVTPYSDSIFSLPYGKQALIHSSTVDRENGMFVFRGISNNGEYYRYKKGGNADISLTSKYNCQNQELCQGITNKYSCSSTFERVRGTDICYYTLSVERSSPYNWTSGTCNLYPGEVAKFREGSGIYSQRKIKYSTWTEVCDVNMCTENKLGYRVCNHITGQLSYNITYCESNGQICKQVGNNGEAKCINPYIVEISIKDSSGFERSSFQKNKPIKIYISIKSETNLAGNITLDIREQSVQGISTITPMKTTFLSDSLNIFELDQGLPITGTYYIILKIDYPGLKDSNYHGINPDEFKTIEIVDQFTATLRVSQTLGGVPQSSPPFYLGYPVVIEYLFQELGETPTYPENATVSYQVGNDQKIQLQRTSELQDNKYGYWIYSFTPIIEGIYKFDGTAKRGNFITPPSIQYPFNINKDEVIVNYKISHNPVQINKLYSGFLTFTTKNRNKILIETSNIVKVSINGVDSGTVPVLGSGGQYSVDYTFINDNSAYVFSINSVPVQSDLKMADLSTSIIKSGNKEEEFCKSNAECGFFGICKEGNCETNLIMIITIFVGGIILFIILYMGYKFYKNRKAEPSIGDSIDFGGL